MNGERICGTYTLWNTTFLWAIKKIKIKKKKTKILPAVTIQVDLEGIILSKLSQMEKDKYHMISLLHGI